MKGFVPVDDEKTGLCLRGTIPKKDGCGVSMMMGLGIRYRVTTVLLKDKRASEQYQYSLMEWLISALGLNREVPVWFLGEAPHG